MFPLSKFLLPIVVLLIAGGAFAYYSGSFPRTTEVPVPTVTPQPSVQGGEVTLVGVQTCLPHKNTDGPQTLECAMGIKTDVDTYYALDLRALDNLMTLPSGKKVTIKGTLVPMEALSSDRWQKYNAVGIVKVLSFEVNED